MSRQNAWLPLDKLEQLVNFTSCSSTSQRSLLPTHWRCREPARLGLYFKLPQRTMSTVLDFKPTGSARLEAILCLPIFARFRAKKSAALACWINTPTIEQSFRINPLDSERGMRRFKSTQHAQRFLDPTPPSTTYFICTDILCAGGFSSYFGFGHLQHGMK